MPDVNLLRDTKEPTDPPKPPPPPGPGPLTDPSALGRPGIGGIFRSLFNRGSGLGNPPTSKSAVGRGSVGKTTAQERILSETKKSLRPGVVPLPEDQGNYDVNLLTEDLVSTFSPQKKFMQLGLIALGAAVVVGLGYAGLKLYASNISHQVSVDRQQLDTLTQQTASLAADQQQVTSTTNKIAAVKALIDRHTRWTRFFAALERYTLPTVNYGSNFTGDISGSMTLAATTTSFDEVAKQYLVLEQAVANKDFISSFSITGASETGTGGDRHAEFTISLNILHELLENPPQVTKAPTTSVPSTTTPTTPGGPTTLPPVNLNVNLQQQLTNLSLATQALADALIANCHLYDTPADASYFPQFMQSDVQKSLQEAPQKPSDCSTVQTSDMNRVVADLKTDADKDGLNLLFEHIYGTSDSSMDTNNDGQTDYQFAQQQYQSSSQSSGGTNTNSGTNTNTP